MSGDELPEFLLDEDGNQKTTRQSTMRVFKSCPAHYNYKQIGVPETKTDRSALIFGTRAHAAIADYEKSLWDYDMDHMTEEWIAEQIKRTLREFSTREKKVKKVIKNFTNFEIERFKKYGAENYPPLFVEEHFVRPPFRGTIDAVFRTDKENEVIVVDWKTGKGLSRDWYKTQLSVYSYDIIGRGFDVVSAEIRFVETGMKQRQPVDVQKAINMAYDFFKKTSNPNYHYPKRRSWKCAWCDTQLVCFAEDYPTVCPGDNTLFTNRILNRYRFRNEIY